MLRFDGTIERRAFILGALLRVGLFVVATVAFPFLLYGAATALNCSGPACGAFGLLAAITYKPIVSALFIFSMLGICIRRARTVGLPWWAGFLIPFLFGADWQFLTVGGTGWSFGFTLGILGLDLPWYAIAGLLLTIVLSALPEAQRAPSSRQLLVAAIPAAGLLITAAFHLLRSLPGAMSGLLTGPLRQLYVPIARAELPLTLLSTVLLCGALGWIGFAPAGGTTKAVTPSGKTWPALPLKRIGFVSVIIGVVLVAVATTDQMSIWPFAIFAWFVPMVVPTALIVFLAITAFFMLAQRRTPGAAVFALIALLPFAHWGYEHLRANQLRAETEQLSPVTAAAPSITTPVVVEGENLAPRILRDTAVETAIFRGEDKLTQYFRRVRGQPERKSETVATLPDRFLLLRAGRASRFVDESGQYGHNGPFELFEVIDGAERLLAFETNFVFRPPSVVPVLSFGGWLRPQSRERADLTSVEDFVASVVGRAPVVEEATQVVEPTARAPDTVATSKPKRRTLQDLLFGDGETHKADQGQYPFRE